MGLYIGDALFVVAGFIAGYVVADFVWTMRWSRWMKED